ncbi:MAG TPA: hypothetical protein VFN27_12100 [Xanthobacteraceae bacterium]|nr:hypothetical protein [Xanthobacteraceae bacterium]
MEDFPIVPPLIVKDTPEPRRLTTLSQARAYFERFHCICEFSGMARHNLLG